MVKNPPAMQEIWVQVDVWNRYLRHFPSGGVVMNLPADTAEKGKATHSSILAWRITWRDDPGRLYTVHGVAKSWS